MHPLTDEIARRAAAFLNAGRESDVSAAILAAVTDLRAANAPPPTPARVRKHAQAMKQQELGSAAYAGLQLAILNAALDIMTLLESAPGQPIRTELVGRAAAGPTLDGDLTMHIRACTTRSVTDLARILSAAGCAEPQFNTLHARAGRFSQLAFSEDVSNSDVTFVLTRVPPGSLREPNRDLLTGKPTPCASSDDLRRRLRTS